MPAPSAAAATPPSAPGQSKQVFLSSFEGSIKRPGKSPAYAISALAVAILMVLLPLLYLGLIALAAYGVYFHAVNDVRMLQTEIHSGRAKVLLFLLYIGPIVAGAIMIVFMVKPFFFRPAGHSRSRSLNRESEPLLFAFVDRICEQVGAAKPKRIDVDCQVNASAGFRRGVLSMFGNDLVLTIGLPLMAGLSARQFAGVLAHEFGHFAQGTGMRLSYLIRSLNMWFLRVVYQRDSLDEQLQSGASQVDVRIGWILYLAMGAVWLSRRVLWALMRVGDVVGGYLLRQMEFDADRYEARLSGSDAFASTMTRVVMLDVASNAAFADLRESYREGRLCDDLPQLIVSRAENMPEDVRRSVSEAMTREKTLWFHTHPCSTDRIASAQREAAPGVFRLEAPATELLRDFRAHSLATTLEFYRGVFGNELARNKLRPLSEFVAEAETKRQGLQTAFDYFFGEVTWRIPPTLPYHEFAERTCTPDDVAELSSAREKFAEAATRLAGAVDAFAELDANLCRASSVGALALARLSLRDGALASFGGAEGVKRAGAAAQERLPVAQRNLQTIGDFAAARLVRGMTLLQDPKILAQIPEPRPDLAEVSRCYDVLRVVCEQLASLSKLVASCSALDAVIGAVQAGQRSDMVDPIVTELMRAIKPTLDGVRSGLKRCTYPFPHTDPEMTLVKYVMPELPLQDDLASIYNGYQQTADALPDVFARLLGRLTSLAVAAETVCGLAPLVKPQEGGVS
jgi:Zn-dependent protease with chaperone function